MIVLDTTVMIDHLRNLPDAVDALQQLAAQRGRVRGSVVSRVEVLSGARRDELPLIGRLFRAIDWVGVSAPIADLAGAFAARYGSTHSGIDLGDYLIAATAATLEAELWTRNVRHFPMFEDLAPPY